jgi:hypothetical protein
MELDFLSRVGGAPNRDRHIALQHHVVVEDCGKFDVGVGAGRKQRTHKGAQ